jgi:hypothetical protein
MLREIRRGRRRLVVASLLCVAMVVSGCQGGHDSASTSAPVEQNQVAALRALPFTEHNVDVVTGVLRQAGVGISADTAAAGAEPVRLTAWQARNLAAEAANGGGIRGDDLTALAGTPPGAPPLSYLVAAWLSTYDSGGARFAKALMGKQDWRRAERLRYPRLVLVLFLADATAGAPSSTGSAAQAVGAPAYRLVAAGPCTTATTFIQNAIVAVANALKVDTSRGGLFGFLGKIWNTAVDLAAGLVKGLIEAVTRPVVNLLVEVFGVVATIAQVTSFLVEWRITQQVEPDANRFGVDSEVLTGSVAVVVDHDQLPIPELILDCAAAVGVDLRNAGSTTGSTVTWESDNEGRPDLSSMVRSDSALDQARSAHYTYRTGQEPADTAKNGDEHSGLLHVTASVQRNDVEKVRQLFTTLLLDQLPQAIRGLVEGYAKPILDASTQRLTALSDLSRQVYVPISYHSATEPTPPPQAGASQPAGSGRKGVMPPTCPNATAAEFGYHDGDLQLVGNDWACWYIRNVGEYQLAIGVLAQAITEADVPGAEALSFPGADRAWIDDGCTSASGPCYGIDVVIGKQTLRILGGTSRDETIAIAMRVLQVG